MLLRRRAGRPSAVLGLLALGCACRLVVGSGFSGLPDWFFVVPPLCFGTRGASRLFLEKIHRTPRIWSRLELVDWQSWKDIHGKSAPAKKKG